ncbi:MAG: dockerin type I domain-containing protein, partial [Candidatus Poribacteria bacterium]|nr:dockerin type I domain-containing protein [Candidatus Poribacteria bacterium]
ILQGIRANVREDFLIIINSRREFPHFAPYINGVFIEARAPNPEYTYRDLYEFETLMKWYESNLRQPAFTLLWGRVEQPLKSQRRVRLFTTLSLTHSDGYVSMSAFRDYTYYYNFWDAPLGRPIGGDETKAQLYENREGLFIREFTNGWAVYNRSGSEQQIEFAETVSGWSSGVKDQRRHTLADLDGEIYLKSEMLPTADVNNDGVVNIQDLVIVANALGETEPDLNGDGVVNIQDLVIVANAF